MLQVVAAVGACREEVAASRRSTGLPLDGVGSHQSRHHHRLGALRDEHLAEQGLRTDLPALRLGDQLLQLPLRHILGGSGSKLGAKQPCCPGPPGVKKALRQLLLGPL